MKFYGYKIRLSCVDWEQVEVLDKFWSAVTKMAGREQIVGLGMEWANNEFTYAMGSFDKNVAMNISEAELRKQGFEVTYLEKDLPDENEWQIFEGKEDDLQEIYDKQVDCYNRKYDYELEFFDGKGGLKLMIHYIDDEEKYKLRLKKTPEGEFNRVHAILVTKDGRVLLRYKNGEPRITGGRIDAGEDLVAALKREVLEELNCEIDLCDYLGYLEVNKKEYYDSINVQVDDNDGDMYWARMVARVSKILPPKADPDRDNNWIYGRVLAPREIATAEMEKVPIFGANNLRILNEAYKVAREKNYFTELPSKEYETLNVESKD